MKAKEYCLECDIKVVKCSECPILQDAKQEMFGDDAFFLDDDIGCK